MKKRTVTTLITALAVTSALGLATHANACSRLVTETEYGTLTMRSADWVSTAPFNAHVSVFPVGSKRTMRGEVQEYENAYAQWVTKHHTVSFEEHGAFNGLSGHVINDKGLNVMGLSQGDSSPYLAQHKDNGAPAINTADLATFIAENYATTAEVKAALDNKEFQIAWASAANGLPGPADLHFSVVDKNGQILLIELEENGIEKYSLGDSKSDLRVKTNDPFQAEHRRYLAQFDLKDPRVASAMPWGIGSKERYARLLALSEHMKLDGLSYAEAVGRQKSSFDSAVLVPFGIQDPNTGEDYPTYFTVQFNLDNGDIWFRSMRTGREAYFNIDQTKGFKKPMHADIMDQVDAGASDITWK